MLVRCTSILVLNTAFLLSTIPFNFLANGFTSSVPIPVVRKGWRPIRATTLESEGSAKHGIGVGIDLGTTNSALAYLDGNSPRIIEIPGNGQTIRSVVAFNDRNELVGHDASNWEARTGISAYRHVKRVMGVGSTFLSEETTRVVPHLITHDHSKKRKVPSLGRLLEDAAANPVKLKSTKIITDTSDETISPEEISAVILRRLLDVAANYTKQEITRAVIGVPAYFNDAQREATVVAAKQAGIQQVKLLLEPEAAALAYGMDKDITEEELVLVIDLGGGTYDVSILLMDQGLTEVVCTAGNAQLGGSNFDARIAKHLFSLTNGNSNGPKSTDVLVRVAEAVRIYLSSHRQVQLALPLSTEGWLQLGDPSDVIVPTSDSGFESDGQNATHKFVVWTRREMERLCVEDLQELLRPIREAAIMAGALLPGDASPLLAESALEMKSGDEAEELFYDEVHGTSEDGSSQANSQMPALDLKVARKQQQRARRKARDVSKRERNFRSESRKANTASPTNSAPRVHGDGIAGRPIAKVVLVGGATRMPVVGRIIATLTGVVPRKTVDPDLAVALGCAVHVGVLDGKEEMGTVLNPMQAAILRAIAEKQQREGKPLDRKELEFFGGSLDEATTGHTDKDMI